MNLEPDFTETGSKSIILRSAQAIKMLILESWHMMRDGNPLQRFLWSSESLGQLFSLPPEAECVGSKMLMVSRLITVLSLFQNEWTEAVDTGGCDGALGANGDGSRRRQSRETRWSSYTIILSISFISAHGENMQSYHSAAFPLKNLFNWIQLQNKKKLGVEVIGLLWELPRNKQQYFAEREICLMNPTWVKKTTFNLI